MRIGVVSNLYPPFSIGGYEQLCGKVCDELASLGHDVVVLTSTYGSTAAETEVGGVERRLRLLANEDNIYRPFEADPDQRAAIIRHNRDTVLDFGHRHRPDLWFAWNLFFLGDQFLDDLSSFDEKVALLLTDNWLIAARQPDALGQFFARHVHGPERFSPTHGEEAECQKGRQWAIFGSSFMRDLYRSFGFAFERETVIHNGVQLPMLPPELHVDRAEPREPGLLKILFAGRIVDIKGPQLIVSALPLIKERSASKVSLTIVGDMQDAPFAARLEAQIAASGCAENIEIRDPVKETLLVPLFNDHDVYVFPSLYEPFSLTLIHAIGAGIPTIASAVGGNCEIVKDGETGLLFDKDSPSELAEAVLRLAEDARLRTRLSQKGRHLARRFSFRRMVTRIETELLKAVA